MRLAPLPGEAIDSWLDAYARMLHVKVPDILAAAGLSWDAAATRNGQRPWLHGLGEAALAALGEVAGVPPRDLAGMTLARYEGTGLTDVAPRRRRRKPRWWSQRAASRYCPRCLAGNGGRWMLAWRLPWAFACAGHRVLLADACAGCGQWQHLRASSGQPRQPGRCDLAGLPLPAPRPARGRSVPCSRDPAMAAAVPLPEGGLILTAWQHVDDLISALPAARDDPARLAVLQQGLDDLHTVARAAIAALHGPAALPAAAGDVLAELGVLAGMPASTATEVLTGPARGQRRRHAPVIAFGTAIADIMLHGRHDDPDPVITGWLADTAASRGKKTSPADTLARWGSASTVLRTALVKPLQPRMDAFGQLRHGTPAGPACIPVPGRAGPRAAAMPSLLWEGWALRLMPPDGFRIVPCRAALSVLVMVASAGASDYRTAQELLGLSPVRAASAFTGFLSRLREHGTLDPVLSAACQLARRLDEHGAPVGYARRRHLPSLSQAQLDVTGWRHQRSLLTGTGSLGWRPTRNGTGLPAGPRHELFARLRLIELLTGTHPCYLPGPLRLPGIHGHNYAEFTATLPGPLARFLDEHARHLLHSAGISEPVTWEPPAAWAAGITWPGPDPGAIAPGDLHPLIRSGLPARAIAARLGTTAEHVRLAASQHPAPQPPPGSPAHLPPGPAEPPGIQQLRDLTRQGLGPRKIAKITGCAERTITLLLAQAGLQQPAMPPARDIDPHWLKEQYQARGLSFRGIAAESGIPARALAAAARNAGIPTRKGASNRDHPLARLGSPGDFPPAVWNAFSRPHAQQRIRRLLAACGHPSLQSAAHHLGTRAFILASQVRQLEAATGTTLLHADPDGRLTLTSHGQQFATDAMAALERLRQSSASKKTSHATSPQPTPE